MNKHWILIDCNYMCWRHYFQMRKLSYENVPTGVMFGFMRDLNKLKELFGDRFVFCFDYGDNKRKKINPDYKASRATKREEMSEEEKEAYEALIKQINSLRDEVLPEMGFRNIVFQSGYEADDVIARICKQINQPDIATIISGDHDLYQLIKNNVSVYHPITQQRVSMDGFIQKYQIDPPTWRMVKAIAGCNSDDIKGVPKVGEKTAVKFLNRELKPTTKAYKAIMANRQLIYNNLPLVHLPLKGTKSIKLQEDTVNEHKWQKIMDLHGMRSLRNKPPKLKRKEFIDAKSEQGQFI